MFRNILGYIKNNKKTIISFTTTTLSVGFLSIVAVPCMLWGSVHTMNYLEKKFPLNSLSISSERKTS